MSNYTDEKLLQIWNKGSPISGYDSNVWRRDYLGNAMRFSDYGNTDSDYGWEVDHIKPVSEGGSDELHNLRPLQWKANRERPSN
ncbi:MAG: HNH endonuclease signature motif containing protein [Gammaproteobacteria bacterium]|nr:HNH endonuclease signature motif containing protein [Gammaproteobacteria bacterium]